MAAWPQVDADRALLAATLRLLTPRGGFAGTGFLIDAEGGLLTCHHVVAGHEGLTAVDTEGETWLAEPDGAGNPDLARFDLAMLRISGSGKRFPPPLPLVLREPGATFRSRAHHADQKAFRDPAPLIGELRGPMRINYTQADRPYSIDGLAVVGAQVQQGMSGAPVWDVASGAVVGLLAVSANDPNLGGFAIPLARAAGVARLREAIAANDRQVARFGDRPNRLGLTALLSAGTAHTIERLKTRGIVGAAPQISREGFDQKLSAFLASDNSALAIVSAAGQGKTNLLVQAIKAQPNRPAWLVRCADVGRDESPAAWLNRLLREAGAPAELVWPTMAEACGTAPLLMLDGLNEAPIAAGRLGSEWLPDLIDAATAAGWRLIYTTRRELFGTLPGTMRPDSFVLGRYTRKEARDAASAYGLRGFALEREPLLLRFRAEVGGGARRSEVLDLFVRRLLEGAPSDAYRGHPEALVDDLAALAERAAKATGGESGVAPRTDPFFDDRPLAQALCNANLLEIVRAGYRFVFDEVADYLHARSAADRIGGMPGSEALSQFQALLGQANAMAMTLEILAERGKTDLAQQLVESLIGAFALAPDLSPEPTVPMFSQTFERLRRESKRFSLFGVVGALPDAAPFRDAKAAAIDWAISVDEIIQVLVIQTDLVAGFPLDGVARIARAAVLLESGYDWRERSISSEPHRSSTVSSARMALGVHRVILDLLDNDPAYGGDMLIGWLSDSTRLAAERRKFASEEATVASFALCMLFAYRERVGVQRLFDDVLKAERPGWSALLEALAAEETGSFLAWLAALDPAYAAGRLDWTLQLWRAALVASRGGDHSDAHRRASAAFSALIPHLDAEGLGQLAGMIVGYELAVPEFRSLIRSLAAAGALEPFNLAKILLKGDIDLNDALELAGEAGRSRLVWCLATEWRPEADRPPLGELVALLRQTKDWREGIASHRHDFELLLYRPDLEAARGAGLCDAVDEQLSLPTQALLEMTYVAFTAERCSAGQADFRLWLADRLLPRLGGQELIVALRDVARMQLSTWPRYREIGRRLARAADDAQMLSACHDLKPPRLENLAELIAAWLDAAPRSGAHAGFLAALLPRLTSEDPAVRVGRADLVDLVLTHLSGGRAVRA